MRYRLSSLPSLSDLPGQTRFGRSTVNKSAYAEIIDRMYGEMQEYMNIPHLNVIETI